MIYMDNAATTMQKPKEVIQAVAAAMESMGNGRDAVLMAHRLVRQEQSMTPESCCAVFFMAPVQDRLYLQQILRKA